MKDIRIFVASSKELEKERNYLAFLVLAKEDVQIPASVTSVDEKIIGGSPYV